MAPAGWSPAPPTTGVPATKPVASVPIAEMTAETSWLSPQGGRRALSMSSLPSNSSLQRRWATSSSSVPEASLTSVA